MPDETWIRSSVDSEYHYWQLPYLSINDDGYSYFGLLSFDGFFQLCLKLSLSGKQEGGDQTKKYYEWTHNQFLF